MILGLGLWAAYIVGIVLLAILVENEVNLFSLLLFGGLIALFAFTNVGAMAWLIAHPVLFGSGIAAYIVTGVGWSFYKWLLFVKARKVKFDEWKTNYFSASNILHTKHKMQNQRINNYQPSSISDEQVLAELAKDFKVVRPPYNVERPKASAQKLRIISWMMYWPVSVFNYLVFDMIRELFDAIYKRVSKVYNKITDSVYGAESEDERNI